MSIKGILTTDPTLKASISLKKDLTGYSGYTIFLRTEFWESINSDEYNITVVGPSGELISTLLLFPSNVYYLRPYHTDGTNLTHNIFYNFNKSPKNFVVTLQLTPTVAYFKIYDEKNLVLSREVLPASGKTFRTNFAATTVRPNHCGKIVGVMSCLEILGGALPSEDILAKWDLIFGYTSQDLRDFKGKIEALPYSFNDEESLEWIDMAIDKTNRSPNYPLLLLDYLKQKGIITETQQGGTGGISPEDYFFLDPSLTTYVIFATSQGLVEVKGIFVREGEMLNVGDVVIQTENPQLYVLSKHVPFLTRGMAVDVNGELYEVAYFVEEAGIVRIELRRV